MLPLSVKERILLYLRPYSEGYEGRSEMPQEITQKFIAAAVGINLTHVPRAVKALESEGLVAVRKAHVVGEKRKLKTYVLTPEGFERVRALMERIKDLRASDIVEGGEERTLNEIWEEGGWRAVNSVLFFSGERVEHEMQIINREAEIKALHQWLQRGDKPFMVIYGSKGVGKSALVRAFSTQLRGKWRILLLDMNKIKTLEEVAAVIGAQPTLLSILSALKNMRSRTLLAVDNYFEVSEDLVELYRRIVEEAHNIKIVFALRDSTPYYNRFYDAHRHSSLIEEMHIKGLSKEAIAQFLQRAGDEEALKQIHMLTKGKPAAVKALIEGDEKALQSLGLSVEEIRLLFFLKEKL